MSHFNISQLMYIMQPTSYCATCHCCTLHHVYRCNVNLQTLIAHKSHVRETSLFTGTIPMQHIASHSIAAHCMDQRISLQLLPDVGHGFFIARHLKEMLAASSARRRQCLLRIWNKNYAAGRRRRRWFIDPRIQLSAWLLPSQRPVAVRFEWPPIPRLITLYWCLRRVQYSQRNAVLCDSETEPNLKSNDGVWYSNSEVESTLSLAMVIWIAPPVGDLLKGDEASLG